MRDWAGGRHDRRSDDDDGDGTGNDDGDRCRRREPDGGNRGTRPSPPIQRPRRDPEDDE